MSLPDYTPRDVTYHDLSRLDGAPPRVHELVVSFLTPTLSSSIFEVRQTLRFRRPNRFVTDDVLEHQADWNFPRKCRTVEACETGFIRGRTIQVCLRRRRN